MPDQCYFTDTAGRGNFYQCAVATSAGQSPATTPASWSKIQIPANWRWVLARITYANLLEMDGQKDKAEAEHQMAIEDERLGLHQMILKEANNERFLGRPSVMVRQ